jgi:hypothetical protein
MGDSLVHGLASTPRLKKAMTQTMGKLARTRPRASKVHASPHSAGSASLRSEQTEIQNQRRGNDARRKAWKTQTRSFPPFPPRLEIRQKAPDFHISTASTAATSPYLTFSRAPPLPTAFVDG